MSANNKPPTNLEASAPGASAGAGNKTSTNLNKINKPAEPNTKINAPSMANTTKQSLNRGNTVNSTNSTAKNSSTNSKMAGSTTIDDSLETVKEASGVYEIVSENYIILLAVTSAIIIIAIVYFFSETFRVGRALDHMQTYQSYQNLDSIDLMSFGDTRLGDYHVSSAYNAAHIGYQMFDYTSEKIVLSILQAGGRYLEFNVFNSEYGKSAYPVASMGYKKGEWKIMINDTPLETIFEIIASNAFKVFDGLEGCYNYSDPVFIGFNLNTNSNLSCLNLLALLITKMFGERLLPNAYSFQGNDAIADLTQSQLMGKVVIFSSDGFQGSGMEEIVNYCWDNPTKSDKHAMRRYLWSDLTVPGFNTQELIEFNRRGLTIVVPHKEGDFLNTNYNPVIAKELGCQFIAMEFQYVDVNMDYYITLFKEHAMIMKDNSLLKNYTKSSKKRTATSTTTPNTTRPNTTRTVTTNPNTSTTTTRPNTTRPSITRT
jgi:hypothetical protein